MSAPAGAMGRLIGLRRPIMPSAGGRLRRAVRSGILRRALVPGITVVVLAALRVWLSHEVRTIGYDLSEARRVQLRLEHEQRELELEVATLRDPRRLAEAARRRLGMIEPSRGQVVILP